jgi:microcin C transport system substrate-binding protein
MKRIAPCLLMALLAGGLLAGCSRTGSGTASSGGTASPTANGKSGNGIAEPVPAANIPEGDTSVPPELGGPGFTGEGWQTVASAPLGDTRAVKGGAITVSIREWPGNLRMAGSGYNTWLNYAIRDLCYQSLLTLDPNTLDFIPMLASHWKISDDQMTYTFRINPRAHWSDGKPVTADDVVATYKLLMDPTLLEPSAILTYGKLHEPIAKSKYIVEVTAKEQNWRNFLYFAASLTIMPAHEIGSITGKEYLDKYNYKYTAVNGPYIVHERDIDKGNSIILTRRTDWWAADQEQYRGMYNFDKIRFVVVQDPDLAYQKAVKGELDYFFLLKAEWWAKDLPQVPAVKQGWLVRQKIFNDAPNGVSGFALNAREAPLDDVRVRKALQYLYDRKTLIEKLAYNEYVPSDSYFAGSQYASPKNEAIEYSPEKAVALLKEAGWTERGPDGVLKKDGKRLSLKLSWYSPAKEKYLTSFKESCASAGVEILLDRTNPETMWKNLMERKFQMVSIGWGGLIFPNPETSFHSKLADMDDNNNITGFKNERCDELFKKYDLAFSQQERVEIIQEVDHIAYNDHPYVLEWYQPCQRVLYWNKFGMPDYGFHRTSEWEDAFATWWVDPAKDKALKDARRNSKSLPVPPLEVHAWEKKEVARGTGDVKAER